MIAGVLELSWRDIRELRVTDPYSVHRVIYSLFPDERTPEQKNAHQPAGFLYADKGETRFPDAFCFSQTENPWHRYTHGTNSVHSRHIPAARGVRVRSCRQSYKEGNEWQSCSH